jgi:hypothetical protein
MINKSNEPATIQDIKQGRDNLPGYLAQRAGNSHREEVDYSAWRERRTLAEVIDLLPVFHGKNLKKIAENLSPGSLVLDYGCGDAAVALSEFHNQFPDLICEGVTYPVQRDNLPVLSKDIHVYRQDGDEFLRQNKSKYALVYTSQAFRYSLDHFRSLKFAFSALQENGILLVDHLFDSSRPLLHQDGRPVTGEELQALLLKDEYDAEVIGKVEDDGITRLFSIAIRKNKNRLTLPFRLVKHPDLKKEFLQRLDTPFEAVGSDQAAKVSYFYELIENT